MGRYGGHLTPFLVDRSGVLWKPTGMSSCSRKFVAAILIVLEEVERTGRKVWGGRSLTELTLALFRNVARLAAWVQVQSHQRIWLEDDAPGRSGPSIETSSTVRF
jgi:hypothetical protein